LTAGLGLDPVDPHGCRAGGQRRGRVPDDDGQLLRAGQGCAADDAGLRAREAGAQLVAGRAGQQLGQRR
jgi:hypothetical protein